MRLVPWRRAAWLLSALLVGLTATAVYASDPSTTSPGPVPARAVADDPETTLQRALDLERQRDWSGAVDVYDEALKVWPSRTDFAHRRRLCEIHHKLVRRYQDLSFRKVLLRLDKAQALALYEELIDRIQSNYVDSVEFGPLLRRGLDNMEVALRDPTFLAPNAPGAQQSRVDWLRNALRSRRNRLAVVDRDGARAEVEAAIGLGQRALNLPPAAVALEFVYGSCDALDDYTSCLTPDKLEDLYAMIDGNFVGLGVELKQDEAGLLLVGVIRGGPAWESNLKAGDVISAVDGRTVRGLSLDEAAGMLEGNEGTSVEIAVTRRDGSIQHHRLVRRPVEVESVSHVRIVDRANGVGYIRLTGFQKSSTAELDRSIAALKRQGLRHLVLDLRGNPGGLLNVSVEIADRFLDGGVIVSTRGRAAGQSQVYRSTGRATWTMPLTVLIDRDSASASEILAGALKDHRRATILGERSYGKGSVQSIFSLQTVPAGLKLTTAKFYSPSNQPYSEQGVAPDVLVRSAARPAGQSGVAPELDESKLGDPAQDPALELAIRRASGRVAAR